LWSIVYSSGACAAPVGIKETLYLDPVPIWIADEHLVDVVLGVDPRGDLDFYAFRLQLLAVTVNIINLEGDDDLIAPRLAICKAKTEIAILANSEDSTGTLIEYLVKAYDLRVKICGFIQVMCL
jgi:hypothetical protein